MTLVEYFRASAPFIAVAVILRCAWWFRRSHRASVARLTLDLDVVTGQRDRYLARLEDLLGPCVEDDSWDSRASFKDPDDARREVVRWQDRARAALGAFRAVDAQRAAAEDRVSALEEEIVEIGKMTTVQVLALEAEIAEMDRTMAARDPNGTRDPEIMAVVDLTGKVA